MPSIILDISNVQWSSASGRSIVSSNHFGSIFTTFQTLAQYDQAVQQAEVYGMRWPGGERAENLASFNLMAPELFIGATVENRKGLSDVLSYARSHQIPFSMVLPAEPYMSSDEALRDGVAAIDYFMRRLLRGDFGTVPKDFKLEIGNEQSYRNSNLLPVSYGELAEAYLTKINSLVSDPNINVHHFQPKLILEMPHTGSGDSGAGRTFNLISSANLQSIDAISTHYGLVQQSTDIEFGRMAKLMELAASHLGNASGLANFEVSISNSAWAVGASSAAALSAVQLLSNGVLNPAYVGNQDLGARQAGGVIKTFAQMIAMGSDDAAMWGVTTSPSSLLYFSGEKISHGGHAFRMLGECLSGTSLIAGKVDQQGNWLKTAENYDVLGFQDDSKIVLFLIAGDINENTGLTIDIDLANQGLTGFSWVEIISTPDVVNSSETVVPGTLQTAIGTVWERLYETAVVSFNSLIIDPNGKFSFTFNGDFEVARVVISRALLGSGDLYLKGDDLSNILNGGFGNDKLVGNSGNDSLFGGDGNDVLIIASLNYDGSYNTANTGIDMLTGGGGIDTASWFGISYHVTADLVLSTASHSLGSAKLYGIENIEGGNGNDAFYGNASNNQLRGNGGNDLLSGRGGDDSLVGGTGSDTLVGGDGCDTASWQDISLDVIANLTSGLAKVRTATSYLSGIENLLGGAGNDSLIGNSLGNSISGGDGRDTLFGFEGNDSLLGGEGFDSLFGANGNDFISGGEGNDALYGGDGLDNLQGGFGADSIYGGNGNDKISIDAGMDIVDGGNGIDTLIISTGINQTLRLSGLMPQSTGSGEVQIISIENAVLSNGNDWCEGTLDANLLNGGGGNDTLFGLAGNDSLVGGGGDNFLFGGGGDDHFYITDGQQNVDGGMGIDTLVVLVSEAIILNLSLQTAQNFGNGVVILREIENIVGGKAADFILGSNHNNKLVGDGGKDSVYGAGGDDTIFGDEGSDYLYGDDGADIIFSGLGNDYLFGGRGADTFIFELSDGHNQIMDFSLLQDDKIDISDMAGAINIQNFEDLSHIIENYPQKTIFNFSADCSVTVYDNFSFQQIFEFILL